VAAWDIGPEFPELVEGAVHVWIADLDWPQDRLRIFWELLSVEERERAKRFRFEDLQNRYIAAHGILRDILGRYLPDSKGALCFLTEDHGKPFLVVDGAASRLQFNLSHANRMAVYALAQARTIGVDIEAIHPIPELHSIAAAHFTSQERGLIESAPPAEKDLAFLTCWTRKEAYIKAVGRGLSIPLPSFDTFIPPGSPGRMLSADESPTPALRWWISDLPPIPSHVGAVALNGRPDKYSYWRWWS
jgi:4'-phosphopantetheinyl transferase